MNAHSAQETFEHLLAEGGIGLDGLTVDQGLATMFSFYRDSRAGDCPVDAGGDMLLYQWGIYQSGSPQNEDGEFFELNITRQFILDGDEDDNIWQLSLTFKFAPSDALRAIGSGNKWCPRSHPVALEYFKRFVHESPAYQAVAQIEPKIRELDYFNAE